MTTRNHLFVSYAWEDGALAEWLSLKLTTEGYFVWCDRFKILGGEHWPEDIDQAIKNRTFRMLHLVSRFSLHKPNPVKERQLALELEKERGGEELLIPINVDGTKPSHLPWQIVDVAYIPFEHWARGYSQLLKKLKLIGTPVGDIERGRELASRVYLQSEVLQEVEEPLHSNSLQVLAIPKYLKRFKSTRVLSVYDRWKLSSVWAFRGGTSGEFLAFTDPPKLAESEIQFESLESMPWAPEDSIGGVPGKIVTSELLNKSLNTICYQRGMIKADRGRFYFPWVTRETSWIRFPGLGGTKSRVRSCGRRRLSGKPFRYQLGVHFRAQYLPQSGFVIQVTQNIGISGESGEELERRGILARRKAIAKSWWNHHWFSRQMAILHYLSDGNETLTIGEKPEEAIVVSASPISARVLLSINESLLETVVGSQSEDRIKIEPIEEGA